MANLCPGEAANYVASGVVTFRSGREVIGSGTVSHGQAVFSTNGLAPGVYTVYADYSGDANFVASSSQVVVLTVN